MLVLLFTVFLSSFVAYSLNLYWKRVNYWQSRRVPSPKQHWLWGNIEGYRRNQSFNEIFHSYYRQYHDNSLPILGVYSCITPFALITDPQLAKRMLVEDFGYFRNRGLYHNPRDSSNNIFVLDYEKWKVFRSKLSPIFTSGKLKIMLPKFLKATKDLVAVMEEDIIGGDSILDIKELMLRYTVEIIGSCAFGLQTNSLAYPEGDFSRLAQEQTVIGESNGTIAKFLMISFPKLANLLRLQYIPEYMNDFYLSLVKTILDIRESNNMQFNDIFDTLKEMRNPDNSPLSLKEITAQTIFFFQAGYETSAYSLTFALYELARREDLQAKVREEIFNVLRKHTNILSFNCLGEMKYLQQILMETLRLYPISPLILRQCTADYKIPGGSDITLEKGQRVIIPAYSFQRDERYYDQPDTFNPDNFAPDRVDTNILLSFGDGPRNCIGMRFARQQILVGLVLLLRNFQFSFCEKTETPIVFKKSSVILAPQNGVYLKVQKYVNLYEDE